MSKIINNRKLIDKIGINNLASFLSLATNSKIYDSDKNNLIKLFMDYVKINGYSEVNDVIWVLENIKCMGNKYIKDNFKDVSDIKVYTL